MSWNADDTRASLKSAAEAAESYAFELKRRKEKPSHWQNVHDDFMAKFAAYDTVGFAAFSSREELLTVLESRMRNPPRTSGVFNAAYAHECYRNHLNEIKRQFT